MTSKRAIYTGTYLQQNATANGNGAVLNTGGYVTATAQVTGTFTATVNWEASLDGTNWFPVRATDLAGGTEATSTGSAGLYRINLFGILFLRARISGYTSGSVTVLATATA
ncbi:MAG: hypothetical protein NZP34_00340 [Caldilineales bacterium]|nr:hypothetical protein [Caldilineales bacterium]